MTVDIAHDALIMTWFRKKPVPDLIHYSDRGSWYASHVFQARLEEYGMFSKLLGQRAYGELLQQSEE